MAGSKLPTGSMTAIGSSFGPWGTAAGAALDVAGLVAQGVGEAGMSEEEQRRWEAEQGLKRGELDFAIERKRQAERRRATLEKSLSDYLVMGGK